MNYFCLMLFSTVHQAPHIRLLSFTASEAQGPGTACSAYSTQITLTVIICIYLYF